MKPLLLLSLLGVLSLPLGAIDLDPELRDSLDAAYRSVTTRVATIEAYQQNLEAALTDLGALDASSFNRDEKREVAALQTRLEAERGAAQHPTLSVPNLLPTPLGDGLADLMRNSIPLTTPDNVQRWIALLEALPEPLETSAQWLVDSAARGQAFPRLVLAQIVSSYDPYLWTPAAFGPLAQFFQASVHDKALDERVVALLETKVYPALKRARAKLEALLPTAPTAYTLCDPEAYRALLFLRLGSPVDPAELHAQALATLQSLAAEADALVPNAPGGAYAKVLAYLKTEPLLQSEDLDWAREVLDESRRLPTSWFSAHVPDFEVRFQTDDPVPNYAPESSDGHRPARLNLTRGGLVKGSVALGLLWHEGAPGHAYQMGLQMADLTLPASRRDPWPSSFIEGWAVYAETLMAQTPRGQDPYYAARLWANRYSRAVTVALDTGINGLGWTYKDARAFLLRAEPGNSVSYDALINRVIYWPGQLLNYDFGYRQLVALRDEVQKAEGAAFDLKRFHDRLLGLGALPFPLIHEAFFPTLSP